MEKKVVLYARVSTDNQELDNQIEKLKSWAERNGHEYDLYSEKVSSIKERPKFEEIMDNLSKYKKLVVTKIDRFARSVRDFIQRYNKLEEKGVEFQAIDQPINTDDELYGDFMLKQLSLFAELERKMIRRRLKDGFKKAQKEGRVGRPRKIQGEAGKSAKAWYKQGASYPFILGRLKKDYGLDVSRSSLYRYLKKEGVLDE